MATNEVARLKELRETWELGYSIVTDALNKKVLLRLKLSIKAKLPSPGATLAATAERFWDKASLVRIDHAECANLHPDRCVLWTAGRINDKGTPPFALGRNSESADDDLRTACQFLGEARSSWNRTNFQTYIVKVVESHAADWRKGFDELLAQIMSDSVDCHVTLLQCASIVGKSKKTLEKKYTDGLLPAPFIPGGGGKAHEWKWSDIRPVLETLFARKLPEQFPGDRFLKR